MGSESGRSLINVSIVAEVPKGREHEAICKLLDVLLELQCAVLCVDRDETSPNVRIEAKLCKVIE